MKALSLIFLSMVTITALNAQSTMEQHAKPVTASTLRQHLWKERVILIFAPSASDSKALRQREILSADPAGLKERDLVIYELYGEKVQGLRQSYGLDEDFALLLIGKDGGVKLRSPKPIDLDALYALIDGMPMRRAEMKGN